MDAEAIVAALEAATPAQRARLAALVARAWSEAPPRARTDTAGRAAEPPGYTLGLSDFAHAQFLGLLAWQDTMIDQAAIRANPRLMRAIMAHACKPDEPAGPPNPPR